MVALPATRAGRRRRRSLQWRHGARVRAARNAGWRRADCAAGAWARQVDRVQAHPRAQAVTIVVSCCAGRREDAVAEAAAEAEAEAGHRQWMAPPADSGSTP